MMDEADQLKLRERSEEELRTIVRENAVENQSTSVGQFQPCEAFFLNEEEIE